MSELDETSLVNSSNTPPENYSSQSRFPAAGTGYVLLTGIAVAALIVAAFAVITGLSDMKALEHKKQELVVENENVSKALNNLKAELQEMDGRKSDLEKLNQQLDREASQLEKITSQLSALSSQKSVLEASIAGEQKTLETILREIGVSKNRYKDEEQALGDVRESISALQVQQNKFKQDKKASEDSANLAAREAETALGRLSEVQKQIETAQKNRDKTEKALRDKSTELSSLQGQSAEIKSSRAEMIGQIQAMEEQVVELKSSLKKLQSDRSSAFEATTDTQSGLIILQSKMRSSERNLEVLESEKKKLTEEVGSLEVRLSDMKRQQAGKESLSKDLAVLKEEIASNQAELLSLKVKLIADTDTLSTVSKSLSGKKAELEQQKQKHQQLNQEIMTAEESKKLADAALIKASQQLANKNTELKSTVQMVTNLRADEIAAKARTQSLAIAEAEFQLDQKQAETLNANVIKLQALEQRHKVTIARLAEEEAKVSLEVQELGLKKNELGTEILILEKTKSELQNPN